MESPTEGRSIHTRMPGTSTARVARQLKIDKKRSLSVAEHNLRQCRGSFALDIRCGALAEYHPQLAPSSRNDETSELHSSQVTAALQNMENVEGHGGGGRTSAKWSFNLSPRGGCQPARPRAGSFNNMAMTPAVSRPRDMCLCFGAPHMQLCAQSPWPLSTSSMQA